MVLAEPGDRYRRKAHPGELRNRGSLERLTRGMCLLETVDQ